MKNKKLNLTEVVAFALYGCNDDGTGAYVKEYYKDESIAMTDAKGSGHWGADAATKSVSLYQDNETGLLYKVELAGTGKFKDVDDSYRAETIAKIKSKLTPQELELLGIK